MPAYTYILTNIHNTTLDIGVTSNLQQRINTHTTIKEKTSIAHKYNCSKLVYYEVLPGITQAISRERQLKNWCRDWKNELIEKFNPNWEDLSGKVC